MCGICGIAASPDARLRVDESLIERMRDTLRHRGPDDAGTFMAPGVGLGHRRLSIVDVSGGHQPMVSADERFTIVYNGEVYNHPTLMESLRAEGVAYRTRCDTETVLHLYARNGADCVRHLRGMFAFAIWDSEREELFLARDRFGIKPLYYVHDRDGNLWFASEIKALLAGEAVRPALNYAALPDFLANHAPSGNDTLFCGVRRLPPGTTLVWRRGEAEMSEYWDLSDHFPRKVQRRRSTKDVTGEYLERFTDAVRVRLMSDVPLGVFLSGGIDSAAITAVMSRLADGPVKTFSVAFAEREANELAYARMVSDMYETDHHEVLVSPDDFLASVPRLVWHEDEPLAHPSSVALNFVSHLAAEHVKVVLSGEGSDETLAGYNRYRVTILNRRLAGLTPHRARSLTKLLLAGLPRTSNLRRRIARSFLARPADLDSLYFDNFAVFDRGWQAELLSREARARIGHDDPYAAFHAALDRVPDRSILSRLLYADTRTYLHELLMKQDQMSMAASIESRVPFLDHPLAEFATGLADRHKLQGFTTKAVLRRAMKDKLPAAILSRRKMGFPVPVGPWLRGPFTELLDEFLTSDRALSRGLFEKEAVTALVTGHRAGEPGHAERLWSLLTLEIWQRIFVDGEQFDEILPRAGLTGAGVG